MDMSLIDRLERPLGKYAIPGLIRYVVAGNALVYILIKFNPYLESMLILVWGEVLHGQIWRLVTYIFIPQFGGLLPDWLGVALYLYYLFWIGSSLEEAMGSFRLNLYYFTGMAGITIGAILFGDAYSVAILNSTLLFAFAHTFPDEMIFFMYIIPVKVKWLAWLAAFGLIWGFLTIDDWGYRTSIILAVSNYILFFGPEIVQGARMRQQVAERRRKFVAAKAPDETTLHECVVCHRTEASNPEMDFRVARDGQEYCKEHLPKPPPAPIA